MVDLGGVDWNPNVQPQEAARLGGSYPPDYYAQEIKRIVDQPSLTILQKLDAIIELYQNAPSQDRTPQVIDIFKNAIASMTNGLEDNLEMQYYEAVAGQHSPEYGAMICLQALDTLKNIPSELINDNIKHLRDEWSPILQDTSVVLKGGVAGKGVLEGALRFISWSTAHPDIVSPLYVLQNFKSREQLLRLTPEMSAKLDAKLDSTISDLSRAEYDAIKKKIDEIMSSKDPAATKIWVLRHYLDEVGNYHMLSKDLDDILSILNGDIDKEMANFWQEKLQVVPDLMQKDIPIDQKVAWLERYLKGGDLDIGNSPYLTEAQKDQLYAQVQAAIDSLKNL